MPPTEHPAPAPSHDATSSFEDRIAQLEQVAPMSSRTRDNLRRALRMIDPAERQALLARHEAELRDLNTFGPRKYADFAFWAHVRVLVAEWLDLDRSPPLRILDIGMGSGSFAMVAQSMGHSVVGTDVADDWYDELCRIAGVRRIVAPVEPGQPYRPIDERFDLITIMLPVFHRLRIDGARRYWSVDQWRAFLSDLSTNLLGAGGRIFILMPLDKADDGALSYSPLVDWASERGARLGRTAPDEPIRLILFDPATPATFG